MKHLKTFENHKKYNNPYDQQLVDLVYDGFKEDKKIYEKIPINKVKELLDKGADINVFDKDKYKSENCYGSILNMAVRKGDLDLVKFLVENDANINNQNSAGSTPLYSASYEGNFEILKFLVDNDADMSITNDSYILPIRVCISRGKINCAIYLLKNGSPLNTKLYKIYKEIESILNNSTSLKNNYELYELYDFLDLLFQMYPYEAIKIDKKLLNKEFIEKYKWLYETEKYNI